MSQQEETTIAETQVDFETIAAEFGQEETVEEAAAEAGASHDETGSEGPDEGEAEVKAEENSTAGDVQVTSEPQELASVRLAEMAAAEAKWRSQLQEQQQLSAAAVQEAVEKTRAELINQLFSNPLAFMEENEVSPEQAEDLALHGYRYKLGDEAPEELVKRTAKSDLDRRFLEQEKRFRDLETKLEQRERELEARQVISSIEEFSKAVPDDMPYLKGEDPAEVVNDICTLYAEIARSGRIPTISECAQMLETQHAKLAQKYTKQSTATTAPKTEAIEETSTIDSETLSDRSPKKTAATNTTLTDEEILASIQDEIKNGGFGNLS